MAQRTPAEAHAEAIARIQAAKTSGQTWLDLGDLGLEEIPAEIACLDKLKILALGRERIVQGAGKLFIEVDRDRAPRINDLTPLRTLTALKYLNLRQCDAVTDLTPLQPLTALKSLNLGWLENVTDLAPLQRLTDLQSLNLIGCKAVTDFTPLQPLTALQSLDLSWCETVTDLTPLQPLTALQSLNLSKCENVTDLTALQRLTALQSLDLSKCENVTDLAPLRRLTALQSLDLNMCLGVTDLAPLQLLTALQSLDLSWCRSVTDLAPVQRLTALQSLNLTWCDAVTDLTPLQPLTALQSLSLGGCETSRYFDSRLCRLPKLSKLVLWNCHWSNLPVAVCGNEFGENVLHLVQAHFADLEAGKQFDTERKVLILGNGGVGKTQLARRLQGRPFDSTIPTTHGIELGLLTVSVSTSPEPVNLHFWDFGGQDIYHGAHSLFLQQEAVYLILWNPRYETGSQYEAGLEMPHRPLTYWLDFVHSIAGKEAPILVVQTQCDRASDRMSHPPASLNRFRYIRILASSAALDDGLEAVTAELKDALKYLLEQRGFDEIGVGRAGVRRRLRTLLTEDQSRPRQDRRHQTLTLSQFRQLCEEVGGVSDPMAFLDFLDNTGAVYYRGDVMRDRLVLDQNWALEGIYTLFHRQKTLPILKKLGGKFTRADLDCLIWQAYSTEEQELFLQVMQACGMCFPTRTMQHLEGTFQEFIAPDLLPEEPESKKLILNHLTMPADAEVEIDYPFLHEGILRGLLSQIGRQIGQDGVFWKYGCWFYEQRRGSELVLDSARAPQPQAQDYSGTLKLRAWKGAATELLETVLRIATSLNIGQPPTVRWLRGHPTADLSHQRSPSLSTATASIPVAEAAALSFLQSAPAPLQVAKSKPEVFISYAWGNDKSPEGIEREQTVDQLEKKLGEWGYKPIRDKHVLRNGDLLSAFMVRLAEGDRVLVILSGAYLKSEACMTEVNGVFKTAERDKVKFLKRIIPVVLSDAKISHPKARADHAKYWHAKKVEMHADFEYLGLADKQRICMISEWVQQIGDILAFISDELHPHGYEQIIANDFAAVRELIARKVAGE